MKTFSLVVSYSPNNPYVGRVVEELNKFSNTILFTTEEHTLPVYKTFYYDKSIERDLTYKPREWVLNNLEEEWDYVLYNEDDIYIPERSFQNVLKLYKELPKEFIPGFIRYEYDPRDNSKRYFDMNPVHAVHRGGYGTVKNKWENIAVWEPWNLHTGNWLLSKADIRQMVDNNLWETSYKQYGYSYGNCDQLESAASVPYMFFTKVFPFDIEDVECQHLPEKYIYFAVNPTLKEIQELYKNTPTC